MKTQRIGVVARQCRGDLRHPSGSVSEGSGWGRGGSQARLSGGEDLPMAASYRAEDRAAGTSEGGGESPQMWARVTRSRGATARNSKV